MTMTTNDSTVQAALETARWVQAHLAVYQQMASRLSAPDLADRQQRLYGLFTDKNLGYLAQYDATHPKSNLFNTVCQAAVYDSLSTMGFQAQPVMVQDSFQSRSFSSRFIPPQSGVQINVSIIQIGAHYRTFAMQPYARQAVYTQPNQMSCDLLNNLFMQSRMMAQYQYGLSNSYGYMSPTINALQQRMNAMILMNNAIRAFRNSPYAQVYDPNCIDASRYAQQKMEALNRSGLNLPNFKDTMNRVLPKIGQGLQRAGEAVKNGFDSFAKTLKEKIYAPYNLWQEKIYPQISEKFKIQEKSSEELLALQPVKDEALQPEGSKTEAVLEAEIAAPAEPQINPRKAGQPELRDSTSRRFEALPFADVEADTGDIAQQFKMNARAIAEGKSISAPENSSGSYLPSTPSLPGKDLEAGLGF